MKSLSRVWLFATPWTVAYQAPPSVGVSRQEYWNGLLFPSPDLPDLPNPGIEPRSSALQADALPSEPPGKLKNNHDDPQIVKFRVKELYFIPFPFLCASSLPQRYSSHCLCLFHDPDLPGHLEMFCKRGKSSPLYLKESNHSSKHLKHVFKNPIQLI